MGEIKIKLNNVKWSIHNNSENVYLNLTELSRLSNTFVTKNDDYFLNMIFFTFSEI